MALMLGLDIGTTGVKALAVRPDGAVAFESFSSCEISSPQPKWAEQNPEDWWRAFCRSTSQLLAAGLKPGEIAAVGLSGQMHSSVFLDSQLRVFRPAILWCDVRTTRQCREITERAGLDLLRNEASNPALEGFTAPKVLWLREHEPAHFEQLQHLLLAKDYIRFRLTGELATDFSDAAGTLLFDVGARKWSRRILSALNLDPAILPPVIASQQISGTITHHAAEETGLRAGTPVVGGGADNACAAVGAGIVEEGVAQASIGSSGVFLAALSSHRADEHMRLHCMNHAAPDMWYLMGVMLTAGLSLKWFKEAFCNEEAEQARREGRDVYDLLSESAASVPAGSEGLIFLPYLNGERTPHADSGARGLLCGLTLRHQKAHMVRAIMEGIAFGLRDSLELVRQLGIEVHEIILAGGGAKSPLWRQIQADVFGQPVRTLKVSDAAPFGAALLAGVGAGIFADCAQATLATVRKAEQVAPVPEHVRVYNDHYPLYKKLYALNRDVFHRLGTMT
ncbi:MAG: xylulokinase [Candidatus Abyssobacteria bacterium SURF_5]|uniref:Xylulose kinase n=1 Tax=Abyssobacteria bacterium (strain SURF_5) TaxID=2093360 RepID=A0A3A4N2I0_ABYX5|nr:MAG: xylulokinase [Candidatus Abyssubacteria bacterium SURF_5]